MLPLCLRRGRIPVVHHLQGQNRIQHEAGDKAVEDQLVVHLLQRCEDSGERANKVVEDLCIDSVSCNPIENAQIQKTHGKSTQLPRSTFLPDGHDLWQLTGNPQNTGTSLQIAQSLEVHDTV